MKRKKLLKTLADLLDAEGRKKRRHSAELKELLDKLERKEALLEEKMLSETDKLRQRRLRIELDVVKAQHAKGVETLLDLES